MSSSDIFRLWTDTAARRRVFESLLAAWRVGDHSRNRALITQIDRAIQRHLVTLNLRRGVAANLEIVEGHQTWLAKWDGTREELFLAGDMMEIALRDPNGPDDVLTTWIHESLHARQSFTERALSEYQAFRGYEEGMVEGLTEVIVSQLSSSWSDTISFPYYVAAYEALAMELRIEVEALWRAAWRNPPGRVRDGFVAAVATLHALAPARQKRLQAIADTVFASTRSNYQPSEDALRQIWRQALR